MDSLVYNYGFVVFCLLVDVLTLLWTLLHQHLLALSLRGNKLENPEILLEVVAQFKSLRALWVNYNPALENG